MDTTTATSSTPTDSNAAAPLASTSSPTPPKGTNVTFTSPDDSSPQLAPIPRIGSLSGLGGYSLTASARTSFTRVDDSAPTPDEPPASTTPQAEQAIAPQPQPPHTPQVVLTFLLVSGRRRTMNFDPTHNVGRVKELLWNAWPGDWQDDRPPAPSFLRILYRGRILQDDDILKNIPFPIDAPATIVHMSIRPGALDDDPSKKADESATCCCVIC